MQCARDVREMKRLGKGKKARNRENQKLIKKKEPYGNLLQNGSEDIKDECKGANYVVKQAIKGQNSKLKGNGGKQEYLIITEKTRRWCGGR